MQELSVDAVLPLMKADKRCKSVRAAWKERRHAIQGAVASGVSAADASTAERVPCIMAEWPSSVLGAVSEHYEDALQQFLHSGAGDKAGSRRQEDILHLRCARALACGRHCALQTIQAVALALCANSAQPCACAVASTQLVKACIWQACA